MSIKEQLLNLGINETEIDTHESDLYVLVNDISKEWLSTYEFKSIVYMFRSEIDNKLWYDIPFGYMNEHYENRFNL